MTGDLQADYSDPEVRRQLGWRTCPVCHTTFKTEQTFCTWLCYLKARSTT